MKDLISRQAAIDAEGLDEEIRCEICRNPMHTSRGCDGNCTYDEKLYEKIMQILDRRIKQLPSAQPEQQWIPCSERLPEHGGRYLISVLDGINRRTTVAPYLPRCKAWEMNGRMAYWKVIAWLPLPEPYKEDDK